MAENAPRTKVSVRNDGSVFTYSAHIHEIDKRTRRRLRDDFTVAYQDMADGKIYVKATGDELWQPPQTEEEFEGEELDAPAPAAKPSAKTAANRRKSAEE